jgi:hypothetical protein
LSTKSATKAITYAFVLILENFFVFQLPLDDHGPKSAACRFRDGFNAKTDPHSILAVAVSIQMPVLRMLFPTRRYGAIAHDCYIQGGQLAAKAGQLDDQLVGFPRWSSFSSLRNNWPDALRRHIGRAA